MLHYIFSNQLYQFEATPVVLGFFKIRRTVCKNNKLACSVKLLTTVICHFHPNIIFTSKAGTSCGT
jgi:hypothetical protein